jgi:YHS domain-containing protein
MQVKQKEAGSWGKAFLALAVIVLLGLIPIVKANWGVMMQGAQAQPVDVLEGLDPVMLAQGKEVQGELKISVTRGGFRYLFATEASKAAFERDPARYEIQLGGHCARMGPTVGGNPDLFAVYQGRIYIFGSEQCKKLFAAAPEKYLEPTAPPEVASTPEAIRRGQTLIERGVAAMGGAAKLDGLSSYQEIGTAKTRGPQGETEFKTITAKLFPDRFRQEQNRSFGTIVDVIAPGGAFVFFYNDRQSNLQSMDELHRAEMEKRFGRNPLEMLRARHGADFKAIAAGAGKVGETMVEEVAVRFGGVYLRVGIDPATGRILSLAYRGRNRSGEVGEVVQTFSDFRVVSGLTLPFKASGTFNGAPDLDQSYTIESITINGQVDPALFEKPKTNKEQ